jgi:archaellum component FlaC
MNEKELNELKERIEKLEKEMDSQTIIRYRWESNISLYVKELEEELVNAKILTPEQIKNAHKNFDNKKNGDYHY